ncbi:MAG TPA: hypothetical protein DSN98_05025 [Thermoplasmata archaeon]|nr:MAG TPA: hypothetical protein DSN98_05025 [Thermoplasmata archaeon]
MMLHVTKEEKNMKQKLGNILLIMLLITASLQIMTFQESNTLADPGAGGSEDGYLDFDYYFDTVSYLSNIIHNSSIYDPSEIKKGRYFGSDGDKAAAKYLKDNFINNSGFGSSDVRKVSLGDVQDASYDHDYTEFVNVTSYALTINHPDFMENTSLPSATIPQDDAYPIVAVRDPEWQGNYTMNTDFDDSRVYNERDFYNLFPKWRYGIQPYNITYDALNDYDIVLGNVTYVAADEEIPPHDYHTVFLLDEVEGVTDQIDNATNASGIILMNNISTLIFQNAENYNIPIMRIDTEDDPNHQNLTLIKQLLENNSIVVADNTIYDNNITFVYNLSSPECGPNHDYVILYNATNPDDWFLRGIMDIIISCDAHYIHNHFSLIYDCKGIIIYDDRVQNCHMMYNQFIDTPRFNSNLFPMFALPGFSVNETIGKFLWNHSGEPDNTIDGHVNQIHYKETDENPGVEAYNVEADLHITQSPNDAVVILSSRYDGMWGECSGDSAAGNGIIMGIAKYMQELNQSGIKPKYNVTFLMTTDEENGYYGAQFYNDTHRNDNIILWIGTEQLGFNTGALHNVYKNATHRIIVENITTLLDYNGKTGYSDIHSLTADITGYNNPSIYGNAGIGAEDVVFTERTDCDTILIHKNNDFVNHHHRGLALTQGDVLAPSNFDWNDAYMFYNITWETVKYFLYNPDCWFSDVSYTVFDSSNDGDSLNDSIRANFTIHSILPHDRVHLELDLGFEVGGMGGLWYGADNADYVVTNGVLNASLVFTIPDIDSEGNYSLCFRLFNSTGRINELVGIGEDNEDDSCGMDHYFPLYHPLGYAKVGNSSQSMHDRICGSIFTANEDSRADNITAYINQNFFETTHYKCMLYRANDSMLIGTTTENWTPRDGQALSPWWAVFNFTGTKPLLVKDTQYVITCWGNNVLSGIYYDESSSASTGRYDYETYGYPPDPAIFTNESRYYSIYCSYTPDVTLPQITDVIASPHTVGFGYNVTITANVTDNGSGVNLVKVRIGEPGGRQNNNTMTHISGDLYRYVFTDTWAVGQYNYSIWAQDNETNSNTSDTYHFHVSADATISIATLRDSYTGNQYINITDPPNPPENYTLVNRGLTWDKYYDAITGQNILEVSAGPINYQEENIWMPINNTLSQLAENHPAYVCGYRSGNNHGLYGV